jgi:hypothetical protein
MILFNGGSFDSKLPTLVKTLIRRKDSGQNSIRTYQSLARCFLLHRTEKSDKIGRFVSALQKPEIWNSFCWRKNLTKIITFFDDLVLSFCILQSSNVVPFFFKATSKVQMAAEESTAFVLINPFTLRMEAITSPKRRNKNTTLCLHAK